MLAQAINPLMGTGTHSATSNNMKLVYWPLMGGLLHLVERGGNWAWPQPAQGPPRCTKCNSPPINGQLRVPIALLLYNGPLLCGFNVPIQVLYLPVAASRKGTQRGLLCPAQLVLTLTWSKLVILSRDPYSRVDNGSVGHGSNGSTYLDGSWVSIRDPLTHE